MAYVVGFLALIATVQGLTWVGQPALASPRQRWVGTVLATLGVLGFGLALLTALVPTFWTG